MIDLENASEPVSAPNARCKAKSGMSNILREFFIIVNMVDFTASQSGRLLPEGVRFKVGDVEWWGNIA